MRLKLKNFQTCYFFILCIYNLVLAFLEGFLDHEAKRINYLHTREICTVESGINVPIHLLIFGIFVLLRF